jgi:hypothetical protein
MEHVLQSVLQTQRALQHIDIILSSRHPEKNMPNPEVMICHSFKYHTALSNMTLVQPLPSKWALIPSSMHITDALKHPRKAS